MKMHMLLVGAALFCASIVKSQSTDSVPTKFLDEVSLIATRMPLKQGQTGKVVSIISKAQLDKSVGRSLAQVLNEQAGITIAGALNNLGSPQSVFMRGANAGRTLILMDGVPVSDPSLINNEFDLNLFSLNDVERIEICRGAQSTLYGSDAVAGVINIITVKNDVKKAIQGKATGSFGSFNTFRGNVQLYGRLKKFTYTARYARLSTDGFSAAYDSSQKMNFDRDGYGGNAIHAAVQYQPSTHLKIKAFVQRNNYKTELDAGTFADETDHTNTNSTLMSGVGFSYQKNGVSLTGNYQYSEVKRSYLNDSLHRPGFTIFSTDDYFGRNQFVELFSSIQLGNGFSTIFGSDYRFSNMNSNYFSISSFGPYSSGFKDTAVSQASMYASILYQNKGFHAEIGGRLNVHDRYGTNTTYTFNPSYTFNNRYRIFGSIASGFKAPSLYQLYAAFGNGNLNPEQSVNLEVGVQQTNQRFSNRVVAFRRNIENGIEFNNITFTYFNILRQKVVGLEWEGILNLKEGLQLTFNYTYLHPKETTQSRITTKDTSYQYLLRRPNHQANAQVSYQFSKSLSISLSSKYVGKRFDAGGYRKSDAALSGYFIVNAYAAYHFKSHFTLFTDIQNITNQKFFDVRGYNAIPLMVQTGVTVQW